ncbi:FCD domain-containing protein [Streptomyces sp. J2-1]|uniref:GntR family transcriptional regulator n=1 Tax=Streptomyces corallincola TaxID=2851888 RepID=UPI001C39386D|nr:FCD domain-containing protein [Streptomyces corallincola]MBV2354027.1 FCD domain-containing protein [Streptomyces corallincola]
MQRATTTRTEQTYTALRADILAGRRRPGDRLPFAELCAAYGASMGVLREALSRLTAEGLVESLPQLGFRVRSVSLEDLRELTDARSEIETLVLRRAITDGGLDWESQVLATHHRLERTPQADADDPERLSEEWVTAHAAFHTALLAGCANQRLRTVAHSLRDAAELYRRWSVPLGTGSRDIAAEHREILRAVLDRDADAAVTALDAHIRRTTRALDDGTEPAEDREP